MANTTPPPIFSPIDTDPKEKKKVVLTDTTSPLYIVSDPKKVEESMIAGNTVNFKTLNESDGLFSRIFDDTLKKSIEQAKSEYRNGGIIADKPLPNFPMKMTKSDKNDQRKGWKSPVPSKLYKKSDICKKECPHRFSCPLKHKHSERVHCKTFQIYRKGLQGLNKDPSQY